MHPHIPRPRRKATRTCTETAGVMRTVHGEFMWPFTARVNEETAPIERIAAVAICRRLSPRCASQQNRTFNVRFGSKADMCSARGHVRFTLNSGYRAQADGGIQGPTVEGPQLQRLIFLGVAISGRAENGTRWSVVRRVVCRRNHRLFQRRGDYVVAASERR